MELEEVDGVRMTWNVWPRSRLEAAKCVIPFATLYSPAKQTSQLQVRTGGYWSGRAQGTRHQQLIKSCRCQMLANL